MELNELDFEFKQTLRQFILEHMENTKCLGAYIKSINIDFIDASNFGSKEIIRDYHLGDVEVVYQFSIHKKIDGSYT